MPFAPFIREVAEVPNKNVIASMAPEPTVRGVTIPAGTADIVPGRVLGRITASGKFGIYADANVDGTGVASAIALNFAPLDAVNDQNIHVAISGHLVLDQLVGLDAAAVTDMGGRQDTIHNVYQF
jgi:hypothetical protein